MRVQFSINSSLGQNEGDFEPLTFNREDKCAQPTELEAGVCLVSGAMVLDADQPALIRKRGFSRSIHLFLGHGQA